MSWKNIMKLLFGLQMLEFRVAIESAAIARLREECKLHLWPTLEMKHVLRQPYNKSPNPMESLPQKPIVQVGDVLNFRVNYTCSDRVKGLRNVVAGENYTTETDEMTGILYLRIISNNRNTIIPSRWSLLDAGVRARYDTAGDMSTNHPECKSHPKCAIIFLQIPRETNSLLVSFWIDANTVGRSELRLDLIWMNATFDTMPEDVPALTQNSQKRRFSLGNQEEPPLRKQFSTAFILRANVTLLQGNDTASIRNTWSNITVITVLLKQQIFYYIFDWTVYFVAIIISMSNGFTTDPKSIKIQFKDPKALCAGLMNQLIFIPLLSLAVVFACRLPVEMAYGLFVTTVIQNGGASFIVISLSNECDQQFSAVLVHVTSALNWVLAPIWICLTGIYLFQTPILVDRLIGLTALVLLTQLLGALLRWRRPAAAKAILTWISRPLLLLFAILLVTLGVYINQYVFQHINRELVIALMTTLTLFYILGWVVGLILRLDTTKSKVLASHASVFQGCLAIPVLRMGILSPEGELASTVALWMIFLMPVPLVYHACITIVRRLVKKIELEHKLRKCRSNGPIGTLCNKSLATVAATTIYTRDLQRLKDNSLYKTDDASSLTIRSFETWPNNTYRDGKFIVTDKKEKKILRGAVIFKDGMTEADRERFLEKTAGRRSHTSNEKLSVCRIAKTKHISLRYQEDGLRSTQSTISGHKPKY